MELLSSIEARIQAASACSVPDQLHPISSSALQAFLRNEIAVEEFARLFSLVNSAYLSVTDCILSYAEPVTAALTAL